MTRAAAETVRPIATRVTSRLVAGVLPVICPCLVACGADLAISDLGARAAPVAWAAGDQVCVVQPEDGRLGDTVYYGSGAAVANRIAHVIVQRREVKVIRIDSQPHVLEACAARRGTYAVVPRILRWEHRSNAVVYAEVVKLDISLLRSDNQKVLRTVGFEMKDSRPNILIPPHDLLPPAFDDAVVRLLAPD